ERSRERNLFRRGGTRGREIGRPEPLDQTLCKHFDDCGAVVLARLDDLHQGRPTERIDAEEAAAKGRARLADEPLRVDAKERESAGDCPFAGFGRLTEHEGVRRIEANGFDELHSRGPPVSASSHAVSASLAINGRRSTSLFGARRTRRSPLASISRRTPLSPGSHCK